MNAVQKILQQYPVVRTQEIAWGDMDALGHVNNVRYYDYSQETRVLYMSKVLPEHLYTVIVSTSCQYLKEVKYPDTVHVGARIKKLGNTSIAHEFVFVSEQSGDIVATGESVMVLMNKNTKQKQPIDADLKNAIEKLEHSVRDL